LSEDASKIPAKIKVFICVEARVFNEFSTTVPPQASTSFVRDKSRRMGAGVDPTHTYSAAFASSA
jgi:hypothetical protein